MTLGKQLQATITELEQAKINKRAAQVNADLLMVRKARAADHQWLIDKRDTIVRAITTGKVPSVNVSDYARQDWLTTALKNNARNQDLWDDAFVQFFLDEELTVVVNDGHDGCGMKSWKTITVFPIPNIWLA
jgi:hypothetical protein